MTGPLPYFHPARLHPYCALLLAALCWCLAPSTVRACQVELTGDGSAAWREALAGLALAADACSTLRLELADGRARLFFTTRDGRQAVRTLAEPGELAPAIDALLVTDAPPASTDPASARAATESGPLAPTAHGAGDQAGTRAHDLAALGALLVGARALGGDVLISPLLNLEGHLRVRRWEAGLQLGWEIKHYYLRSGGTPYRDAMTLLPALSFAHRRPLGRATLLVGGRFGLTLALQRPPARSNSIPGPGFFASFSPPLRNEAWTGLLIGVVFPQRSRVRMRAELCADLVYVRWFGDYSRVWPGWALSLAIGAEYGRP